MYYTNIIYGIVVNLAVLLGSLLCAAPYESSLRTTSQKRLDTPTQEITRYIQMGNIEQVKRLWVHHHGTYIDKAAIFKSACIHKQYGLIAWLLKTTALATQYQHEYGTTLLIEGVAYNDTKLLALLLASSSIDINAQTNPGGWTALMMAAERSSRAIVKFLLESGADRAIKDFEGRDAIWWAHSVDRNDIVRLLHEYNTSKK